MSDDFLVNASTEGLRALGTAPQRSFELVGGTVAARLGADHAALFAEPVASAQGDRHDWYATVSGTPRRLIDLAEPEQARAREELARLTSDIRALATSLSESGAGDDQRLGEALTNALEIPDEESIWVITGLADDRLQPVLVNWAWVRDRREAVRGALAGADTRARAAVPHAPPSAAPPLTPALPHAAPSGSAAQETQGTGAVNWLRWLLWLGWLLLAAMIAIIFYLMVEACALRLPGIAAHCPVAEQESALARDRLVLEDRVLQLERHLATADRACQPVPEERVDLPPLLNPPNEMEERMRQSGAQLGDLTFTLIWDSRDDIDLHVTCPAGETVSYRAKEACGGQLDVDSNAGSIVPQPIENVFFNNPLAGAYQVRVNYYESRTGGAPRSFELQIRDRENVQTLTGEVSPGRPTWETTYQTRGQ